MVKILAALSILNSSSASPGATKKVAALLVTDLDLTRTKRVLVSLSKIINTKVAFLIAKEQRV